MKWIYKKPETPDEVYEFLHSTILIYKNKSLKGECSSWLDTTYSFKCSFCSGVFAKMYAKVGEYKAFITKKCPLCGARFIFVEKSYQD